MCAREKAIPGKMWRIAGEPIWSQPLTAAEQEQFDEEFPIYWRFRGSSEKGMTWVTPAAARLHQSAAQSVAAFLCERYEGRYERETVIKVVSSTAAIPAPLSARMAVRKDFLLGAALWLLDYWEEHCENEDKYLSLFSPETDEMLEYGRGIWSIPKRQYSVCCSSYMAGIRSTERSSALWRSKAVSSHCLWNRKCRLSRQTCPAGAGFWAVCSYPPKTRLCTPFLQLWS